MRERLFNFFERDADTRMRWVGGSKWNSKRQEQPKRKVHISWNEAQGAETK
jgi:hypothetical protein